jgi:hypothetical protein
VTPSPFGEAKGPLDALREYWGTRSHRRRTLGTPKRTRAQALLWAIEKDAEALAKAKVNDALKVPELGQLAEAMTDSWASEGGWDTHGVIKSLEATTGTRQNPLVKDDGRDP